MTSFVSNTARAAHYQRLAADAAADPAWVEREVRRRSVWPHTAVASTEAQIVDAAGLAVALYEAAAAYGVDRRALENVTDFIAAAIDGIRMRDRR